jgi:hypothetical protein
MSFDAKGLGGATNFDAKRLNPWVLDYIARTG